MFFLDFFLVVVGVLVSIAFFTLLERKFLGYFHFRKGPTKILVFGLLQPISDALKLFGKEGLLLRAQEVGLFYFSPFLGVSLMFLLVGIFSFSGVLGISLVLVVFFAVLSLGVYFLLFSGWGSNSKFSLVGSYRGVSQMISYEVCFSLFVLSVCYVFCGYDLLLCFFDQGGFWFIFVFYPFSVGWLFVCISESNRAPFDFSEGESELVSGFNVEYSGGLFSVIFVCEYGMVLLLCMVSIFLFFGGSFFMAKVLFFSGIFLWIRGCFPRFRYDFLMGLAWKKFLPLSLCFLVFCCGNFFS